MITVKTIANQKQFSLPVPLIDEYGNEIPLLIYRKAVDDHYAKMVAVSFVQFPKFNFVVWRGDQYDAAGDWTQEQLFSEIQNKIDSDPKWLASLLPKPQIYNPRAEGGCPGCRGGGSNNTTPTLAQKVGSAASSVATWAANGFPISPDFENRLAICQACPSFDSSGFGGTGSCKLCGCSTQAKLRLATSTCPDGRW